LVKISRNSMILRRIQLCRRIVRVNTQALRQKLLFKLQELYDLAHDLAKDRKLDLVIRNKWARVAAYTAQTINSIASEFDEQQINCNLSELERLVVEARAKAQARKAEKAAAEH
jgi:hypothetical protein